MKDYPSHFGCITTPSMWRCIGIEEGRLWAGDNQAFTKGFNPEKFFPFLESMVRYKDTCLFVALPDVVADSEATLALYWQYRRQYREYPFPTAFVAQDGLLPEWLPPDYDVLFIGGSTEFKLSKAGRRCIDKAKADGKKIHIGRVNTEKRIRYSKMVGADFVDGTCIAFGKNINIARLNRWIPRVNAQRSMF